MKKAFFALLLMASTTAQATLAPNKNNLIEGFSFSSCGANFCASVVAPRAWMSLLGGFTTDGATELRMFDRQANLKKTFLAVRANYNAKLELLTLESENEGFVLLSLKDGKISDFTKHTNEGAK